MRLIVLISVMTLTLFSFGQQKERGESISFRKFKKAQPTKVVDFGVKGDLSFITQDAEWDPNRKRDNLLTFFGIIDLPLSFVADTILLPVNALQDSSRCNFSP